MHLELHALAVVQDDANRRRVQQLKRQLAQDIEPFPRSAPAPSPTHAFAHLHEPPRGVRAAPRAPELAVRRGQPARHEVELGAPQRGELPRSRIPALPRARATRAEPLTLRDRLQRRVQTRAVVLARALLADQHHTRGDVTAAHLTAVVPSNLGQSAVLAAEERQHANLEVDQSVGAVTLRPAPARGFAHALGDKVRGVLLRRVSRGDELAALCGVHRDHVIRVRG